jgi:hypothetical protein
MNKQRILIAVLALAASASTAALAQEKQRIANEGTIGDKWMLAENVPLATAAYPPSLAARGGNACIALGYLIGKDGTTSDFAVLKQWSSESDEKEPIEGYWQAFAQAGADAVSQWRFKARPGVGVVIPTYTVATLGFQGKQDTDPAALRGHCQIKDLADQLERVKSKRFERGDSIKQDMEHNRMKLQEQQIEETLRRANSAPKGA